MNSQPTALSPLFISIFLLTALSQFVSTLAFPKACAQKRLTTAERCFNPPFESSFNLRAYTGRWHQIFASGGAALISNNHCLTANYTLRSEKPIEMDVLNCRYKESIDDRPSCVKGSATGRTVANVSHPAYLQVQVTLTAPPAPYTVAAIVGNQNYGYQAVAVYTCFRVPSSGQLQDGFFILSRSPYAPYFIRKRVIRKLRCNGYAVNEKDFVYNVNNPSCQYIGPPLFVDFNDTRQNQSPRNDIPVENN